MPKTLKGKLSWLRQMLFTLSTRDKCSSQSLTPPIVPVKLCRGAGRSLLLKLSSHLMGTNFLHVLLALWWRIWYHKHMRNMFIQCTVFFSSGSASICTPKWSSLVYNKTCLDTYMNNAWMQIAQRLLDIISGKEWVFILFFSVSLYSFLYYQYPRLTSVTTAVFSLKLWWFVSLQH